MAFLNNVNFREIAQHLIDDYYRQEVTAWLQDIWTFRPQA
jgi:hypothetical protein